MRYYAARKSLQKKKKKKKGADKMAFEQNALDVVVKVGTFEQRPYTRTYAVSGGNPYNNLVGQLLLYYYCYHRRRTLRNIGVRLTSTSRVYLCE